MKQEHEKPYKRPMPEELNLIEARAARVAMEGFMLTLREGLSKCGGGPEGEKFALLDFFKGTEHLHSAFITGTVPGKLTFYFRFDVQAEVLPPAIGRAGVELPLRCRVGPVLQALMMKDCMETAVVVCVDAQEKQWVACSNPEHQKGAIKKEPVASWLEREGWLGGTTESS